MARRRSTEILGAGVLAGGLVLVAHTGCMPDLDSLSGAVDRGSGGLNGGGTSNGGSSGTGGDPLGNPNGGASSSSEGTGGGGSGTTASGGTSLTGGPSGNGGAGGTGSGGTDSTSGGSGGSSGAGGASCEDEGLTTCSGGFECTDLDIGQPEGRGVTHCGDCGVSCSLHNASAAGCEDGACRPTCEDGFDDCNSETSNDGCEADLASAEHCGACGAACSNAGATQVICDAGQCQPTCVPFLADCNATEVLTADDGCETYLDSLTACRPDCATSATSCDPAQVCTVGACAAPQGIVVFTVPFTEANQINRYSDLLTPTTALAGTDFLVRIYAPGASQGQLVAYFSSTNFAAGGGGTSPLSSFATGWKEMRIPIGNPSGDYDPDYITQLNFEIQSASAASWEEPVVIYIDAVRSMNGRVDDTFDADLGRMVKSSFLVVEGATIEWIDALP